MSSDTLQVIFKENVVKIATAWNVTMSHIMEDNSLERLHQHVMEPLETHRALTFSAVVTILFFGCFVGITRACFWMIPNSKSEVGQTKKADFLCKMCCYSLLFMFEAVFLLSAEGAAIFSDPRHMLSEEYAYVETTKLVAIIYAMQLAYYASQLYSFITNAHVHSRRGDYLQEQIHHSVAFVLIALSYAFNVKRCGVLLVALFDPCDILLNSAKLLKGTAWKRTAYFCFFLFNATWFYARVYYYPAKYLWVCIFDAKHIRLDSNQFYSTTVHFVIIGLLLALAVMQLVWTKMIVVAAIGLLKNGKLVDKREPDERDSPTPSRQSSAWENVPVDHVSHHTRSAKKRE